MLTYVCNDPKRYANVIYDGSRGLDQMKQFIFVNLLLRMRWHTR